MATEREYRDWQVKRKRQKKYKKPSFHSASFWLLALLLFVSYKSAAKNSFDSESVSKLITQPQNFNLDRLQVPLRDIKPGTIQAIQNTRYTDIDNWVASINYQGSSVKELATLLSSYATTEPEKARIIYSWIAFNISYDTQAYFSGNYGALTPEGVLKARKAVCSGYANLYQALAQAMGLEVVVIDGYAKGASYAIGNSSEPNHAWNAVKINQGWYLIDTTWGAGHLNGREFEQNFNSYYFATPPEQFIYSHFPSNTTLQLLTTPYSKQQFESLPEVSPNFFEYQLQLSSHTNHTIYANKNIKILLESPPDIVALAQLELNAQTLDDKYTVIRKEGNKIAIYAQLPNPGTYELYIFSKNKHESGHYEQVLKYKVISN